MNEITQRQHFVPRTFLKHFAEKKKYRAFQISVFHSKEEKAPYKTNIENVCQQNNLYTIDFDNATNPQKMALEGFYSRYFEQDYDEIFELLTDDSKVEITLAEKDKIINTKVSMYFRVAKWLNQSTKVQKIALEKLMTIANELNNFNVHLGNGNYWNIEGKSIDDLLKDLKTNTRLKFIINQLDGISKIVKSRIYDSINIYTPYGDHEFITSDVPIVLNNGEVKLITHLDERCHITLNFSPKHCITLIPGDELKLRLKRVHLKDNCSFMIVGINNDHQFRNSERYILGTEKGINFYIEQKPVYYSKEAVNTILMRAEEELRKEMETYNYFIKRFTR